ncbi:MAG: alpha-amylase family glycosyl hydrolase [Candidatus Coproplasma sp.]
MKKAALLCTLSACLFALTACGSTPTVPETNENGELCIRDEKLNTTYVTDDNNRVFYEIFVGSFSDSNGDGTGDLRGIINRFDYLNDGDPNSGLSLGVEGIWLTPIFSSPTYHKYDVTDYYKIDPKFGTEDDLVELVELCHERNVKLILDLPINHTSTSNAMFQKFSQAQKSGDTENKYYDYYSYYVDGDPAPSGRTFNQLAGTDVRYECNFEGGMPELNYDNQSVREEMLDVAKYYLNLGLDGFRFDAAKYIYYGEDAKSAEFWKWYVGELKQVKSDVYTVAEVWASDSITQMYAPATNCFNFTTSQTTGQIAVAAKGGDAGTYCSYVEKYVNNVKAVNPDGMIIPFIANHDNDRAAGFLSVSTGQMQVAANLLLLSCGSPFIYYGEEIGLKGSRGSASTDANRRLAMRWGDDDTVVNPAGSTYPEMNQVNGTVADQKGVSDSLYNHYKKLIMIRNANPEIARGEYKALKISGSNLGGFTSTLNGSTVAVLHNTTTEEFSVDLSTVTSLTFSEIRAIAGLNGATLNGTILTIGAQTSVVIK